MHNSLGCSLNIQNHTFLEGNTKNDSDGSEVYEKSAENTYNSPKVLLSNVRSLVPKIDGIREFVLRMNVHLALIAETWLRPSISDGVVLGKDKGVLASTRGMATTTPKIKNLIGRVWKNSRAARAACSCEQVRAFSAKQQRDITTFTVLMNT